MQLIYSPAKGVYQGNDDVMNSLSTTSAQFGILNYELYKRVLKEYKKHKSVYDLSNNSPYLLILKSFSLAKYCKCKIEPTVKGISDAMLYAKPWELKNHLWPGNPEPFLATLKFIFEQVGPYITVNKVNLETEWQKMNNNFLIDYYSWWDFHSIHPRIWIANCLRKLEYYFSENQVYNIYKNKLEEVKPLLMSKVTNTKTDELRLLWKIAIMKEIRHIIFMKPLIP